MKVRDVYIFLVLLPNIPPVLTARALTTIEFSRQIPHVYCTSLIAHQYSLVLHIFVNKVHTFSLTYNILFDTVMS